MGTNALSRTGRLRWDVASKSGTLSNSVKIPASPDPVLELACFVKPPTICFESVRLGSTQVKVLRIFNPGDEIESIVLEKFPCPELGFAIEGLLSNQQLQLHLQPNEEVEIKISWKPVTAGNSRHLVTFKWIGGQKLQLVILASAYDPNAGKKKIRRVPMAKVLQPSSRLNISKEKLQTAKRKNLLIHEDRRKGCESPNVKHLVEIAPDTPSRRSTFTVSQLTIDKDDMGVVCCDEKENISEASDSTVNSATFNVKYFATNANNARKNVPNNKTTNSHGEFVPALKGESFVGKIDGCNHYDESIEGSTFHESEIRLSSSPIKCRVDHEHSTSSTYKRGLHPGQFVLNGEVKHGFIPFPSFEDNGASVNMEISTMGKQKVTLQDGSLSFDSAASSLFTITREEKFYPALGPVDESKDPLTPQNALKLESKTLTNDTDILTPVPNENVTWLNTIKESGDVSFAATNWDKFYPILEPVQEVGAGFQTPEWPLLRTLTNKTYDATPLPCDQCIWTNEVGETTAEKSVVQKCKNDANEIDSKSIGNSPSGSRREHECAPENIDAKRDAAILPIEALVKKSMFDSDNQSDGCCNALEATACVIQEVQDQTEIEKNPITVPLSNDNAVDNPTVDIGSMQTEQVEEIGKSVLIDSIIGVSTKESACGARNVLKKEKSMQNSDGLKNVRCTKKIEGSKIVPSRYMSSNLKKGDHSGIRQNQGSLKTKPRKEWNIVDAKFKGISLPQKRGTDAAVSTGLLTKPSVAIKKLKLTKPQGKITRHPMPYAAKNMFYDERWIEKQERGFKNWLNFVLTPPDDDDAETRNDVRRGTICLESEPNQPVAPTREALSFKMYAAKRRMAKLRRDACALYQTDQFASVIHKIEREIEHGRLAIRLDRHVDADIGVRSHIADMMLSFNPLWLRIGLEVVYGEILPISRNHDSAGLSRFIHRRLLANPDIAADYSHPSVPGLHKPGYVEALGKFTLKKILLVIIYLDKAKSARLIKHDPCLFNRDSQFKSVREMLLMFSRDYLHREGDIVKHIKCLGYTISHIQTPLNEYDFGVSSLAVDLRDGLRLVRVVELMTENWSLSSGLRVPAVSRLQKIHNVELAFKCLKEKGLDIKNELNIDPRYIVDGHREKTLNLLWKIIFHFQIDLLLNEDKLKDEIHYLEKKVQLMNDYSEFRKSAALNVACGDLFENSAYSKNDKLGLLLKWSNLIGQLHGVKIENFTVCFSDGRAFCYLLHHYHPALLSKEEICDATCFTAQETSDDELDDCFLHQNPKSSFYSAKAGAHTLMDTLLLNEKHNLSIFCEKVKEIGASPAMVLASDLSNTIPDEKVVITYLSFLCSRLLDLREEIRAARCIQLAWRQHHLRGKKAELEKLAMAATKIQALARGVLVRRRLKKKTAAVELLQRNVRRFLSKKKQYLREHSAIVIQRHYSAFKQTRVARRSFLEKRTAAVTLQRAYREILCIRERKRKAALSIQAAWRKHQMRKLRCLENEAAIIVQMTWRRYACRKRFLEVRAAAATLQSSYRAYVKKRQARDDFLRKKRAVLTLEMFWRQTLERRETAKVQACVAIQACFRSYQCRMSYLKLKEVVIKMQSYVRARQCQTRYEELQRTVILLQSARRSLVATRNARVFFQTAKNACVMIQKIHRGRIARRAFTCKRIAATKLQAVWRGKVCRQKLISMKNAASKVQNEFRAWRLMRVARSQFVDLKRKSLTIQAAFRGHRQRKRFLAIRNATIKVQALCRGKACRNTFLSQRAASVTIQQHYRAYILGKTVYKEYQLARKSSLKIQSWYRGKRSRTLYIDMKQAAICLQSSYRRLVAVRNFKQLKSAVLAIQQWYRAVKLSQVIQVHYLITKAAVITIQSAYKGYLVRRDFKKRHIAATSIQAMFRGYTERRKLRRKVAAATKIQSVYRGFLQERKYKTLKNATVAVQSFTRRYFALRDYKTIKSAVVKIQMFYRGYLQTKTAVAKYRQERAAMIKIQAVSRGFLCRKLVQRHKAARKLQAFVRGSLQRKRYLKFIAVVLKVQEITRNKIECRRKNTSALCIQQHWKAYRLAKDQRAQFLKRRQACIILQAFVRRWIKVRFFAKLRSATLVIQRRFKAQCLMEQKRSEYKGIKDAAVVIQSAVRMHIVRKQFKAKRTALIKLQKQARILIQERRMHRETLAATAVQQWYKACKEMQRRRSIFCKQKRAAILLQTQFRGFVSRRRYAMMKNSAIKITAWYRMILAKRSYVQKRNAIVTIQRFYRGVFLCRMEQLFFHLMRGAVITIQACVRGFLARRVLLRKQRAAVCLQASWRRYVAMIDYRSLRQSVIQLQRRSRANALAKVERRNYLQMRVAAIKIQRKLRAFFKLKAAAVVVQAQCRMLRDRRRFLMIRGICIKVQKGFRKHVRRTSAAVVLQSYWRMYVTRKDYNIRIAACIRIQSAVRCFIIRRQFLLHLDAALTVQRRYRAYVKGSSERCTYLHKRKSCTLIQAFVRGWMTRRNFVELREQAIVLQRRYRAQIAMKNEIRKFSELKSAAIKIQAAYRGYKAKMVAECIREQRRVEEALRLAIEHHIMLERQTAAIVIQKNVRRMQARSSYLVLREKAVKIQQFYRNRLFTLQTRKRYLVKIDSVLIIQRTYRMYVARRCLQMLKERARLESAATYIQSMYKCLRERKLFLTKRNAVNVIQRCYRSYLLAKTTRSKFLFQRSSAITIQSAYRSYIAKKLLWSLRNRRDMEVQAVVLIQKFIRGFLCRRDYHHMRNAVILIQRAYRSFRKMTRVRDGYIELRHAALKIQHAYRAYMIKKAVARRVAENYRRINSAITIQRTFRRYKLMSSLRNELCIRRTAAVTIQRYFRGCLVRMRIVEIRAALKIQHAYRSYKERQYMLREKSAVKIGAAFRGYIQRRYYQKLRRVTLMLQCRVRQLLKKKRFVRENAAAIIVQRWYHSTWLMKREMASFKRKKRAVLYIQSIWRGYLVRRIIVDRKTIRARERIESAKMEAIEPKKLCNRTKSALSYLLHCKGVSTIYEALKELEVTTRFSTKCCEWLVEDGALPVIYQIMKNCNRSLPSIEQIHMALLVLSNVAKCSTTYMAIIRERDFLQLLIDLMANFREKRKIFPNCCKLLSILCNDNAIIQLILGNTVLSKKLKALNSLICHKAEIELKRTNGKLKLRKEDKKDPLSAMEQMSSLKKLVDIVNYA